MVHCPEIALKHVLRTEVPVFGSILFENLGYDSLSVKKARRLPSGRPGGTDRGSKTLFANVNPKNRPIEPRLMTGEKVTFVSAYTPKTLEIRQIRH